MQFALDESILKATGIEDLAQSPNSSFLLRSQSTDVLGLQSLRQSQEFGINLPTELELQTTQPPQIFQSQINLSLASTSLNDFRSFGSSTDTAQPTLQTQQSKLQSDQQQENEQEADEESDEEDQDDDEEANNLRRPPDMKGARGLRMPSGFRVASRPQPESDEEEDEEEEEESEEEDEDEEKGLMQEKHFFQLSKQQYEQILKQQPNNEKIRKRYEELIANHPELGTDTEDNDNNSNKNSGTGRQSPVVKKQKLQ